MYSTLGVSGATTLNSTLNVVGNTSLINASTTLLTAANNLWSNGTTNIGDADADILNIRSGVWNLTSTATTTVAMTKGINFDSNTFVIDPNSGRVGIGTATPLVPLHIGLGYINNSVDSQILISRTVDDSVAGNAHAYSDLSSITRSGGIGYNSFNARVSYTGTNTYDHYAAFQANPTYNSTGQISWLYGFYDGPTISATGNTGNIAGLYSAPVLSGANNTKRYGVYVACRKCEL